MGFFHLYLIGAHVDSATMFIVVVVARCSLPILHCFLALWCKLLYIFWEKNTHAKLSLSKHTTQTYTHLQNEIKFYIEHRRRLKKCVCESVHLGRTCNRVWAISDFSKREKRLMLLLSCCLSEVNESFGRSEVLIFRCSFDGWDEMRFQSMNCERDHTHIHTYALICMHAITYTQQKCFQYARRPRSHPKSTKRCSFNTAREKKRVRSVWWRFQ